MKKAPYLELCDRPGVYCTILTCFMPVYSTTAKLPKAYGKDTDQTAGEQTVLGLSCSSVGKVMGYIRRFCCHISKGENSHRQTLPCRPQWLSWMRRPTRDQEVTCSTPAEVLNILSWRLIMKYILRSFSPFC